MLGIERMDEAVIYDPKTFEVSYRGPITPSADVAIDLLLAGEGADLVSVRGSAKAIYNNAADHANLSYVTPISHRSLQATAPPAIAMVESRPSLWTAVWQFKVGHR